MAHGVARLSPHYCCDHMRLWSLGQPEALFWHTNVFCVPDPNYQIEQDGQQPKGGEAASMATAKLASLTGNALQVMQSQIRRVQAIIRSAAGRQTTSCSGGVLQRTPAATR